MKVAQLFADLGFNVDEQSLNNFEGMMNSTAGKVTLFVGKIAAATFAVKQFAQASIDAAAAMRSFRVETGLSAEELQQWQVVTQLTDIEASAQDVTNSIQSLQTQLSLVRLGEGDVGAFRFLGVDASTASAFDVLDQLKVTIRGLDEATAVNLLQRIGLGAEMFHVLKSINPEMEAFAKTVTLTGRQINALTEVGTEFERFGKVVSYEFAQLNAELAPLYKLVAQALTGAFRAVSNAIEITWWAVKNLVGAFFEMLRAQPMLQGFFTAILAYFAALSLNPFTLAIAGITALILLLDDLWVSLQGGDGVFRKMFDGFDAWIEKVTAFFAEIMEFFSSIPSLIPSLPDVSVLGEGGLIDRAAQSITNGFNNTFNIVTDNPEAAASAVVTGLQDQLDLSQAGLNSSGVR